MAAASSESRVNGGTATFQVTSGTSTISDTISDAAFAGGNAAGIAKTGAGTLTLSGSSRFGGTLSPNEGTLEITGSVTSGALSGIASTGGTATLKVTGNGANWSNQADILIGHNGGTGTLEISGGGTASDTFALVGRTAGGTGHVTVTGTGSTWTHSAGVVIGTGGTGTLRVENGGQVSNADGWIGGDAGSGGTATVTGEDSLWTSRDYLIVGGAGTGVLNVADGGTVRVGSTGAGTLTLANSGSGAGTLNLGAPVGEDAVGAGTVEAAIVTGGGGSGAKLVNFNHTGTDYRFAANLTGGLKVEQNAGNTLLTGTSTYTGGTKVNGGRLAVDGSVSGPVAVEAAGALGGHGTVHGTISGAGEVGPGNSPGILTAEAVNPSGGLGFSFEFGLTGMPLWSDASASGNDLLRLTLASPFTEALSANNTIRLFFAEADTTYYGGFFTEGETDLLSAAIADATYLYYLIDDADGTVSYNGHLYSQFSGSVTPLVEKVENADFAEGAENGYTQKFEVAAVPEPSTWMLLGVGLLFFLLFRGRIPLGARV